MYLGAIHKWCHPLTRGEGWSGKRGHYSISLFSRIGNKGEGGVKSLKKWVTAFMDGLPLFFFAMDLPKSDKPKFRIITQSSTKIHILMIFFENIVVIIKCTSSGFVTYNHTLIFMIGSHTAIHIVSQGINMRGIFKLWLKIIRKMVLNEIFQQDTSKLAISYEIRKSMLFFFHFWFHATLQLYLECPGQSTSCMKSKTK